MPARFVQFGLSARVASLLTFAVAVPAGALAAGPGLPTSGPDVTISALAGIGGCTCLNPPECTSSFCEPGAAPATGNGYVGYSVGTTACNIGDVPVNWCASSCGGSLTAEQHPVIAQGIYRLHGGRLQQLGMSWLKHGFLSTNSEETPCRVGTSCIQPPLDTNQLGVGCTDTYGALLNGVRPLGMRSEVSATTGLFPFPFTQVAYGAPPDQRVRILESDLDLDNFPGARFFAEGQYVADNDALGGNGLNNASYGEVSVHPTTFEISLLGGSLVRERSALHAWRSADPAVELFHVDVPGEIVERFELARRVTQLDADTWHYEYALRNMNSDRAARAFAVDLGDGTTITDAGFHGVEHHSGEPYSTSPWEITVDPETGTITWQTAAFAVDPNANALRWATMFNFWFDAGAAPDAEFHSVELFAPGSPAVMTFRLPIFADGFEAHNLVAWSAIQPSP